MNTPRRNHGSCALGKFLYVFFGDNFDENILSIERLPVQELGAEWEVIYDFQGSEYPVGRLNPCVATLNQTDIIIMGGIRPKVGEVFIFDTQNTSFKKVVSSPNLNFCAPKSGHCVNNG